MSSSKGTVDSKGYFTPSQAGNTTITATCDGVTGSSGQITIDFSYSAAGSATLGGVTYKGTKTDNGKMLSEQDPDYLDFNPKIDFDYPQTDTVTADGFVRIKGKLTPSTAGHGEYDRVFIIVSNGTGGNNNKAIYACEKDFDLRVWLPFSGQQTITVAPAKLTFNSYVDDEDVKCEGDLKSWGYFVGYEITATNTHNNGSLNGRNIYASGLCQADSYVVQNFTNEALYGVPSSASTEDKFAAIHDYVVLNLYYDDESVSTNGNERKKQDAVSVIKNRTAVCEGYSNLIAAMCRYAGIPANVVVSNELCHAWNYIYIDGKCLFCDTTWDDPYKDPYSDYISYNYFLLTDYDGINRDHAASDKYIDNRQIAPQTIRNCELSELYKQGFCF